MWDVAPRDVIDIAVQITAGRVSRLIVIMRGGGATYDSIASAITDGFHIIVSSETVRRWVARHETGFDDAA